MYFDVCLKCENGLTVINRNLCPQGATSNAACSKYVNTLCFHWHKFT